MAVFSFCDLIRVPGAVATLCACLSATAPLAETDLVVDAPAGPLAATLALPDATRAAVLILPGSGPTDRNGDTPTGVVARPYALLAQGLAQNGVASLRADKRGIGKSAGDPNAVTLADYAADAAVMIDLLKTRAAQDCVWVAGHSEGGLIALKLAQTHQDLCGLVLLAAPGRPLSQILLEQLTASPAFAPHLVDLRKVLFQLVVGKSVPVEGLAPPLQALFAPRVQPFLIDLFAHDPAALLASVNVPVLIVQGSADLQITQDDADALARARADAARLTIQGMTHMLKTAPGDSRADNLSTYTNPDLPLANGLLAGITAFVLDPQP